MPRSPPRAAAGIRPGSSGPHGLKTTTNSRNILLVFFCLCAVRSRQRELAAGAGQLSRGHRNGAGHGPHRPDHHRRRAQGARGTGYPVEAAGANASRRPGPGSARIPSRDIVSTFTSRDAEATGNPGQALAVLDDHLATLFGNLVHAGNAGSRYGHVAAVAPTSASGATSRKPPDCRTRMRADRPDLHAQRVHSP
jgi:hypothetical protein